MEVYSKIKAAGYPLNDINVKIMRGHPVFLRVLKTGVYDRCPSSWTISLVNVQNDLKKIATKGFSALSYTTI